MRVPRVPHLFVRSARALTTSSSYQLPPKITRTTFKTGPKVLLDEYGRERRPLPPLGLDGREIVPGELDQMLSMQLKR